MVGSQDIQVYSIHFLLRIHNLAMAIGIQLILIKCKEYSNKNKDSLPPVANNPIYW